MDRIRVTFEPDGVTAPVLVGSTAHAAAMAAGVRIDLPCGGVGRCGRCKVRVDGEVSPPTSDEMSVVAMDELARGIRLACRVRLLSDATVNIADRGQVRVMTDAVLEEALEVEPPSDRGIDHLDDSPYLLGAAVDIGTTTVAVSLIDLENGDELATSGMLNVQYPWGADVMTRITMAVHEGTAILQQPIAMQIERMIVSMLEPLEATAADVREIAVVGNTAMTNAFLGADLSPLASAPYEGAALEAAYVSAALVGMSLFNLATCYVLPGISAFVGADVTADLVATALADRETRALLLDLGTNGEMVLSGPGGMIAASAAAGPALEGAGIMSGMRAEPGAIERVWLEDSDLAFATIGGTPPMGICGSGVLDLVAALLEAGVLDSSGRLLTGVAGPIGERVIERGDIRAFVVDADAGIVFSQKDVRAVQLAKGAVRTALDLLLAEGGLVPEDVGEVLVAGGFGYHVEGPALARIGLIPAEWTDRLTFVGNTAKEGARRALVASAVRRRAEEIAASVRTLELVSHPDFQSRYIASLDFPRL